MSADPDDRLFDNDDEGHRHALVKALRSADLDAYEYHSGGGMYHVVVDLVDDPESDDLLQIATGSAETPCDIGLMGWRRGASWKGPVWSRARTMDDALAQFAALWTDRARIITAFEAT